MCKNDFSRMTGCSIYHDEGRGILSAENLTVERIDVRKQAVAMIGPKSSPVKTPSSVLSLIKADVIRIGIVIFRRTPRTDSSWVQSSKCTQSRLCAAPELLVNTFWERMIGDVVESNEATEVGLTISGGRSTINASRGGKLLQQREERRVLQISQRKVRPKAVIRSIPEVSQSFGDEVRRVSFKPQSKDNQRMIFSPVLRTSPVTLRTCVPHGQRIDIANVRGSRQLEKLDC